MPHLSPEDLARTIFPVAVELSGGKNPRLETLAGGASIRRYHRVTVEGGKWPSVMVMELGDNPLKSEEASKGRGAEPSCPSLMCSAIWRAPASRFRRSTATTPSAASSTSRTSATSPSSLACRRGRRRARTLLPAGDRPARRDATLCGQECRSRVRRLLAGLRLRAPQMGARPLPRIRARRPGPHISAAEREELDEMFGRIAGESPRRRAASCIATIRAAT